MLVIWQGAGILAVVIPIGSAIAATFGLDYAFGEGWTDAHPGFLGATLFLTGIAVWFIGRRLNRRPGKTVIDPKTKQQVILKIRHTVFFVPMEYAAIFWCLVGAFLFVYLK
jgi:hypothetical protein